MAQTPTVYFVLEKTNPLESTGTVELYDADFSKYVLFNTRTTWNMTRPIPCRCASIINKLDKWCNMGGTIKVKKTNMPSKFAHIVNSPTEGEGQEQDMTNYPYKNVKTCITERLSETQMRSKLVYQWSDIPLAYHGKQKVILAHKQHGLPYMDATGELGVSYRDNYVLSEDDYTYKELCILKQFLSSKLAMYLFESTRYRMKYLEKYVFELIPDVARIGDFSGESDEQIYQYFEFTEEEIGVIDEFTKRTYSFAS
jgi:hypothetical protein